MSALHGARDNDSCREGLADHGPLGKRRGAAMVWLLAAVVESMEAGRSAGMTP
ncbi:MAG: hypothetical protein OXI87_07900 [Albidovulum sp.]|nr:hypothetical protein [Albidovulum sp.]MDE0534575.1 hypothetical protein [Albidovulum sp.]